MRLRLGRGGGACGVEPAHGSRLPGLSSRGPVSVPAQGAFRGFTRAGPKDVSEKRYRPKPAQKTFLKKVSPQAGAEDVSEKGIGLKTNFRNAFCGRKAARQHLGAANAPCGRRRARWQTPSVGGGWRGRLETANAFCMRKVAGRCLGAAAASSPLAAGCGVCLRRLPSGPDSGAPSPPACACAVLPRGQILARPVRLPW